MSHLKWCEQYDGNEVVCIFWGKGLKEGSVNPKKLKKP